MTFFSIGDDTEMRIDTNHTVFLMNGKTFGDETLSSDQPMEIL